MDMQVHRGMRSRRHACRCCTHAGLWLAVSHGPWCARLHQLRNHVLPVQPIAVGWLAATSRGSRGPPCGGWRLPVRTAPALHFRAGAWPAPPLWPCLGQPDSATSHGDGLAQLWLRCPSASRCRNVCGESGAKRLWVFMFQPQPPTHKRVRTQSESKPEHEHDHEHRRRRKSEQRRKRKQKRARKHARTQVRTPDVLVRRDQSLRLVAASNPHPPPPAPLA